MSKIKVVQIAMSDFTIGGNPYFQWLDDKGRVWTMTREEGVCEFDLPDEPTESNQE